ncbi:hypothetical protein [Piscibacillus salipiscarius]|uniref:hypothetical protein n=1 Tax=Piscibacillus salipiscarius TaxID=299480 RepID=UPI0006D215A7|nr:hypothetical protein [Piscibacillus salipiscarius]
MSDDGFITLSNEFKHLEDDYMKLGKMYNEWKNKYGEHLSINYVDPKTLVVLLHIYLNKPKLV